MKGPAALVRSNEISGLSNVSSIYEWAEGKARLTIDRVDYQGRRGGVLCYANPPVHQVGNPELDAYLAGLAEVRNQAADLSFLIIYGPNDPVHAGGDLKESLTRLDHTLEMKKKQEAEGAAPEEIDHLFHWADGRLEKGFSLYQLMREIASRLRLVAVCGGGTRFGGSAEIPLMADYLVGDGRSGMCFSEAMIGLIPGWAGVGRTLGKAGLTNTKYMAMTSKEVKGDQLRQIGIYNEVVEIPFGFPRRQRTDDPKADKAAFVAALGKHDWDTGLILLPEGLALAVRPEKDIPGVTPEERLTLAEEEEVVAEVSRRRDPRNYADLWSKPLKEVKDEMAGLGRPLAPQSVEALEMLFESYEPRDYDEERFVAAEKEADARLYRDPRFRAGLVATLEQRVPDFRMP